MLTPNLCYANLKESYLFHHIALKTGAYLEAHPGAHLFQMGIGDVSLPLAPAVIEALHRAVEDQAEKDSFHARRLPPIIRAGTSPSPRRRSSSPAAPAMSWGISWICSIGATAP